MVERSVHTPEEPSLGRSGPVGKSTDVGINGRLTWEDSVCLGLGGSVPQGFKDWGLRH